MARERLATVAIFLWWLSYPKIATVAAGSFAMTFGASPAYGLGSSYTVSRA